MKITAKRIVSTLTLLALLLSLVACGGGSFTCDTCGKEKTGKSYQETLLGEKITICKDCYDDMKALMGD